MLISKRAKWQRNESEIPKVKHSVRQNFTQDIYSLNLGLHTAKTKEKL